MHANTKLSLASFLVAGGIFAIDLHTPSGLATILYVILIWLSLLSKDAIFPVWSALICTVLIFIGYAYVGENASWGIIGNRIFALIIVWLSVALSVQSKEVERELRQLNETLELKVLARTISSENRAIMLEKQIKILEGIRQQKTEEAFKNIDEVIDNLRNIKILFDDEGVNEQ